MQIWRLNMRNQTFTRQAVPTAWERLGGRGLIARILLDEVDPTCDPLGMHNKLIFAPGLLVGGGLSSCDRISVGTKSPLTGGIKEANAGGTTGLALVQLGVKALILEDQPEDERWWVIHLTPDGVQFEEAGELVGLGVYESAGRLIPRYGEKAAISLIGPAGEMGLLAAGIVNLDKDRIPSRINARGGVGAVMGSKRIKALIFDPQGSKQPGPVEAKSFQAARKEFTQALSGHPQTEVYRDYGTAAMAQMCDRLGGLPTHNFSNGQFEKVAEISGERLRENILERGRPGNPSHACMPGCLIRCSNVYTDEQGQELVSPLEYETIGLMGSNLGISSLDDIARLNWTANDLGVDTIEIGAALGVLIAAGKLAYGDFKHALAFLQEMYQNGPNGRLLGDGAAAVGAKYGVNRVPVVKRQAISAYDPRAIKGTGVTYATSPQGADHTAGLTIRARIDHTKPEGQVDVSRTAQYNMAGYDTLGACIFAGFGFAAAPHTLTRLLAARFGWPEDENILPNLGKETIRLEREFNRRAGFTPEDDRLPDWLCQEPLPPTNAVFDVPDDELDHIFPW